MDSGGSDEVYGIDRRRLGRPRPCRLRKQRRIGDTRRRRRCGGGYEYHLKKQRDRVEDDYRDGKIDQAEYEIRIDQIERDSLLN